MNRRTFASVMAGAGASLPVLAQQPSIDPFADPLQFTRKNVTPKAQSFPMTQVRITGGIYKDAAEWNRGYMSRLSADRLLHNFRQNARLDLKEWETAADGKHGKELHSHFTGLLSASASLFASTGHKDARSKADYMVAELAGVQEKLGGGYLRAFPLELFGVP